MVEDKTLEFIKSDDAPEVREVELGKTGVSEVEIVRAVEIAVVEFATFKEVVEEKLDVECELSFSEEGVTDEVGGVAAL